MVPATIAIPKTRSVVLPPSCNSIPPLASVATQTIEEILRPPSPDIFSQVNEISLRPSCYRSASASLTELAHLQQEQHRQDDKLRRGQTRLRRCQIANALSGRLRRCGRLAHRTLVDILRSDNKKSFAILYDALQEVRDSCGATRRYALLEADLDDAPDVTIGETIQRTQSTYLDIIPSEVRDDLLGFIFRIRLDPDFLASRISSLSKAEISSLTACHHFLDPFESVMPSSSRGKSKPLPHTQTSGVIPSPVERLLSFQRHDPLSLLLYAVFAESAGPDSAEDLRRTDAWSSTCARLITEGTPGGERFMRAVLNAWGDLRPWPILGDFEIYLMQTLQDEASLQANTSDICSGSAILTEPDAGSNNHATEAFFDAAVVKLLEMIDRCPSDGGLPGGVFELARAILRKIEDPKKRRTAQTFIISKWFFSSFLFNVIMYPEVSGAVLSSNGVTYLSILIG